jgi:DNA/RNA endonuclease YhcR with UshA esterase domain
MKASNLLCHPLIPFYKSFKRIDIKSFKGYKLVDKHNSNYYSIASGLFRYKEGKIKHSSYTSLYQNNPEFYNSELHNRLSIFKNINDAKNFLKEYINICNPNSNLVVLEIVISGNLKEALCSNTFVVDYECVIGDCIESIREINF